MGPGTTVSPRRKYRSFLITAVFILVVPLWARLIPGDAIHMDIVNLMAIAGIYACVVIGLNILVGYAGQISLGHAAFFGIGAYTTAILCTRYTWFPSWLGVILGASLAGAIGAIVGKPVLRLKGHYLAMATLGLSEIAFIFFREARGLTGGTIGILSIPNLSFFGIDFDTNMKFFYLVWVVVFILIIFTMNMIDSRVGRSLRALNSSEVAADAMGINTGDYKTKVFILSALLAGLGGAFFAHFQRYINPESFVITTSILFVTMAVIGGLGKKWGAVIGVITLTFFPAVIQAMPEWIPGLPEGLSNFTNYELVLYGILLMLFMIFLPEGIASGLERAGSRGGRFAKRLKDRIVSTRYRGGR